MTDKERAEKLYVDYCNGKEKLVDLIEKLIEEIRNEMDEH